MRLDLKITPDGLSASVNGLKTRVRLKNDLIRTRFTAADLRYKLSVVFGGWIVFSIDQIDFVTKQYIERQLRELYKAHKRLSAELARIGVGDSFVVIKPAQITRLEISVSDMCGIVCEQFSTLKKLKGDTEIKIEQYFDQA